MKANSDNFRNSSIIGIIEQLQKKGIDLLIYEPLLSGDKDFMGIPITSDFDAFVNQCSLIVSNRNDSAIEPYNDKVYTRDIFSRNKDEVFQGNEFDSKTLKIVINQLIQYVSA